MPGSDGGDVLEVRQSPEKHGRTFLGLIGVLSIYVLGGVIGFFDPRLVLLGCVVFGPISLLSLVYAMRARGAPWELRLAPAGVTVRGHDRIPWSDLAEVRVGHMEPRWLFALRRHKVVSFLPRPGVQLPPLPSAGGRGPWALFSARQRQRLYGTQLIVMEQALDTTVDELAAAAQRWGDLPVHR